MSTSFTDWDHLEHHGIKGMKWGVRRYQNEDGSLTELGRARYGDQPTKKTSPRKMAKDFNKLDKGFDNLNFNRAYSARKSFDYLHYAAERGRKLENKGYSENQIKNDKDVNYWLDRLKQAGEEVKMNTEQMKAVEKLQLRVLELAKQNGYIVESKPVERLVTKGQKVKIREDKKQKYQNRVNNNQKTMDYMDYYRNKIVEEQGEIGRQGEAYGNYTKIYNKAKKYKEKAKRKLDKYGNRG